MKRALFAGAALAFTIVFACAEEENTDPLPCTSAPPYALDTKFPQREPGTLPKRACTQRCGDTTRWYWGAGGSNLPAMTTLPSGPCEQEGEGCNALAVVACCDRDGVCTRPGSPGETTGLIISGIAHEFDCRCRSGMWSCSSSYLGGGACSPASADAGGPDGNR